MTEQSKLPDIIAKELKKGTPVDEVKQQLGEQGWSAADILQALDELMAEDTSELTLSPVAMVVGSIVFFLVVVGAVYGVTTYLSTRNAGVPVQLEPAPVVENRPKEMPEATEEAEVDQYESMQYPPISESTLEEDLFATESSEIDSTATDSSVTTATDSAEQMN